MNERRLVRWILFSVPVLCALQWLVVRTIGEPYPAVMMPSFAEDGRPRSNFIQPKLILKHGPSTIYEGSAFDLLKNIDYSAARAILYKRLRHNAVLTDEARRWVMERGRGVNPLTSEVVIRWHQHSFNSEEAHAWLGDLVIK